MPYLEPTLRFGTRILNLDLFDARIRRAVTHPLDQSDDGILVTAEMRLNGAVRAVPDPSADSEFARLALSPYAEKHTLHAAGHPDVARNFRHGST